MNFHLIPDSLCSALLRQAGRATLRFGLRKAGALVSASAPQVVQAGQKLAALSEHPALADPPAFSKPR